MDVIGIKDMSAGNDTVGDMWKETRVFRGDTPLSEVMKWVGARKNVVLSVPDESWGELSTYNTDINKI